jgi:excisionase family DNA binding protein
MTIADLGKQVRQLIDLLEKLVSDSLVPRGYFNLKNASTYSDLSVKTLRRLIKERKLEAYRPVRGLIIIHRERLDAYIQSCTQSNRKGRGIKKTN